MESIVAFHLRPFEAWILGSRRDERRPEAGLFH